MSQYYNDAQRLKESIQGKPIPEYLERFSFSLKQLNSFALTRGVQYSLSTRLDGEPLKVALEYWIHKQKMFNRSNSGDNDKNRQNCISRLKSESNVKRKTPKRSMTIFDNKERKAAIQIDSLSYYGKEILTPMRD